MANSTPPDDDNEHQPKRQKVVDGPLLGKQFVPLIVENNYVLLCKEGCVTVLSYKTGALLYDVALSFASVAVSGSEVWFGKKDGTIQEYEITNHALVWRRTVRMMAALEHDNDNDDAVVERLCLDMEHVYAIVRGTNKKGSKRFFLQHILRSTESDDWSASSVSLHSFKTLDNDSVDGKKNDQKFMVLSEHGIVFGGSKTLRLYNHENKVVDLSSSIRGSITALDSYLTDVAVGLRTGAIEILSDVWSLPFGSKKGHRALSMIRRVHWHAHAVASVKFDFAGRLHSAGEESVWVTWDAHSDQPLKKMPRVCVGPIDHLVYHDDTMMVYCRTENSIRTYELHNQGILWKHTGYGCSTPHIPITVDHDTIAFPGTPGKIHIFHPDQRRVVDTLVVCPYNHVSRMDHDPIPRPYITAVAVYGNNCVTAHISPTEAGPHVCTLQFWGRNGERLAAMSHPHGKFHPIERLAIHEDVAVSLSKKDFMLWHRTSEEKYTTSSSPSSSWTCSVKVTIPSGYSNLPCSANPAFSADGSVLALAFGRFITLWSTTVDAVMLLSSIPMEGTVVRQVVFCSSRHIVDMLLVVTDAGLRFLTITGQLWWERPVCSYAVFAPESELICLAESSDSSSDSSKVFVVDAATGVEKEQANVVNGRVSSLAVLEPEQENVDIWTDYDDKDESRSNDLEPMKIFAATEDGRLVQLRDEESTPASSSNNDTSTASTAPRLPSLEVRDKKRRLLNVSELGERSTKRASLEHFGFLENEDASGGGFGDVPLLRGAFVTAFVGRNILRRNDVS